MTQVPEYLLERSRARRAALGLGGDDPSSTSSSGDGSSGGGGSGGGSSGGGGSAVATAEATPAVASEAPAPARGGVAAPPAPDIPLPDYVADPGPKSGIPYWVMPVLLLLPLWGIVYVGAFGERATQELTGPALGAQVYTNSCASCHGPRGEGGVGPAVAGGESKLTFPNEADHVAWVEQGSSSKRGQQYGDPGRPGGARTASSGGMPAFAGQLSPAQIQAVVLYERDSL